MREDKSLTAAELITALSRLKPDTVVYYQEHHHDYDMWFHKGFAGVEESGELAYGGIIESGDLGEFYDREDDK